MAFRPAEILALAVLLMAGLLGARAVLAGPPAPPAPAAASPEEARLTALLERVAGPGRVHVTIGGPSGDGPRSVLVLVDRAAGDEAGAARLAGLAARSGILPAAAAERVSVERVAFARAGAPDALAGLERASPYLLLAILAIAVLTGVRRGAPAMETKAATSPDAREGDQTDMALGLIRGWLATETRA